MGTRRPDQDAQDWMDACTEDFGTDPEEACALVRLAELRAETWEQIDVPPLDMEAWRTEVREELG